MTKEKSDTADGGGSGFARYVPLMIILGIVLAVGGIRLFCPTLWENYYIPILLIAVGIAIPFLFSPWKFWAGYGFQVGIAPGLAFVLMGGIIWLSGYESGVLWKDAVVKLLYTQLPILGIWLGALLLAFAFRPRGELWRGYGWLFSPAMLILIILLQVSWAKSTLESTALEKSRLVPVPISNPKLYAAYPYQIIYDEQNTATIMLWSANNIPCTLKSLRLSSDTLVFALEPIDGSSFQWQRAIEIKMSDADSMVVVHVQPLNMMDDAQEVFFEITINDEKPQPLPPIRLEGRQETQSRLWIGALLDTGSISIIIGVVVAWIEIRRKEEEERRKREEEINNALKEFDETMQNNFSASIDNWKRLTRNWEKWDPVFQNQVRDIFDAFVEDNLWDAIAGKTKEEITSDVDLCLQICERIFDDKEEKPISTLKQLQSALRLDEKAPLALLSLLKEYPASINAAKIIASAFSPALKATTIANYTSKFPNQVRDLREELGFLDTESFPLQKLFAFYTKSYIPEDRLTAWLKAHELEYSPFADADSPFYSVFDKQFLIDLAAPGFGLPVPNLQFAAFEFANSWDAGAGLFEYCKTLQTNVRLKEELFFAMVTPSTVEKYGSEHSRKLFLHALAEQWIWSLAEAPTLFYTLKGAQRDLAGRLLRWHDFSPSVTVNKIVEFSRHLWESRKEREKEEDRNQRVFFSKIVEWLTDASADDLRTEEINALIGLRPSPKTRTLFLISTIDLNPYVTGQISSSLHEMMNEQFNWLSAHDCGLVRFLIGDKNQQTVSMSGLVNQCNIRVQKCSNTENIVFNQLFDTPGVEPDVILAQKADGSAGKMVKLGQKLLWQHVERYSSSEPLHIEDLEALEV